jgi:hypothetical protein
MKRAIRQLTLPAAMVVLALLVPVQAASASPLDVQRDCADSDSFERAHSRADLQAALGEIQADLAEYGTCKQMILAALATAKAKTDTPNGGGGAAGASADLDGDGVVTPQEKKVVAKRAKKKREQRKQELAEVGDALTQDDAGISSSGNGGSSGGTPLPLILTLVALLCAGVGGGVWYVSKRNPAVANALRRVPLPFRNT